MMSVTFVLPICSSVKAGSCESTEMSLTAVPQIHKTFSDEQSERFEMSFTAEDVMFNSDSCDEYELAKCRTCALLRES